MTAILSEIQERFLMAIVAQVPAARIAEIHFFAPIKQGGVESGVAVVASNPEGMLPPEAQADGEPERTEGADDAERAELAEQNEQGERTDVVEPADGNEGTESRARFVIYTARYRYTLKGPDRGKWETNVVAEADAPLVTVDAVVRGVQRRSGDVDDPTRMDGDEVRAIVNAKLSV